MVEYTSVDQLISYLHVLKELNASGYHCSKEIAEAILKIREYTRLAEVKANG